jgi:hypothetical protein
MCKLLACVFASIVLAAHILMARATDQPLGQDVQKRDENKEAIEKFVKNFTAPIQIRQSKPVIVNDAQFVVVAQTDWKPPEAHSGIPMIAPVDIQLHITNLSKGEVFFPTLDTFGVRILTPDGKELKPQVSRSGAKTTTPVVLPPGSSYALCRRAEIRLDEKTKHAEFIYYDGTGARSIVGPLKPGGYKLVFWYSVSSQGKNQKNSGSATWLGEVVTKDVPITVFDDSTRGVPGGEENLGTFPEPVRIRQSKPVTANEASFVAVAQTNWKTTKTELDVPVEIQLRVTNLSKKDRIFPTFDTFGLKLFNMAGKRIMPGGGRKITILTRPILLPPGVTYAFGPKGDPHGVRRRAELHWDPKTKASQLFYFDGTGSVSIFRRLEPGQHKLAFWYEVSQKGPIGTERDPATWIGEASTEDVNIDVQNP